MQDKSLDECSSDVCLLILKPDDFPNSATCLRMPSIDLDSGVQIMSKHRIGRPSDSQSRNEARNEAYIAGKTKR